MYRHISSYIDYIHNTATNFLKVLLDFHVFSVSYFFFHIKDLRLAIKYVYIVELQFESNVSDERMIMMGVHVLNTVPC